uniref:Uncharacterized protein n=1 Tax=Trichobilharzia regenti TaxID=157069 RepID=A0AA85JK60_TRIRE|nr:unnamed protein product [Trichobilharzia regenti]
MTVPSSNDDDLQLQFTFEGEYNKLNAQLDAISTCLDILEAKSKKLCDEAEHLVLEYKEQRNETSSAS